MQSSFPRISFCVFLFLLPALSFSATSAGKVRSVLGDAERQKQNLPKWEALRVGAKIIQTDRVRTGQESELVLTLADGSIITITERSEVVIDELLEDNGKYKTSLDIKAGRLNFSAQKQGRNSSFSFKTGTAVAAIRGTRGAINSSPFFAGLATGQLAIRQSTGDKETIINAGQTAFGKDSIIVVNMASSGDPVFAKQLESLLSDSSGISTDSLLARMHNLDENYQRQLKSLAQTVRCRLDSLPDTSYSATITEKGHCDGPYDLYIFGEHVIPGKDGNFTASIQLDSSAYGSKTFPVSCLVDSLSVPCGELHTDYVSRWANFTEDFEVTTESPDTVCHGGLVVAGTYRTLDTSATLILRIGKAYRSGNLMLLADGNDQRFSYKVDINDLNGLWNERKAVLEFRTKSGGIITKEIDLAVNKTCPEVNGKPPVVSFLSYDSLRCTASARISGLEDDLAIFSMTTDNEQTREESLTKDNQLNIALTGGVHKYAFIAKDQAGNAASVSKTLGCFPDERFSINMAGGATERLRVPPPPVSMEDRIIRTLQFQIRLAANDPVYLHKVTVRQNGRIILQETNSQIQSLDYQIPVELRRGAENKFDIEVAHKSGRTVRVQKIYEVR